MNNINNDLAVYLKSKKGLTRLMNKLKEKYISLSRPSGTVIINNITKEESVDISNLLGKRVPIDENIKTSFKEITKKINEGKYKNFDWIEVLNVYFNENIITKEQEKSNTKQEEDKFYQNIFENNNKRKYLKEVKEIITDFVQRYGHPDFAQKRFVRFDAAQRGTGLKTVILSRNLIRIGDQAFQGCENLQGDLILPSKITSLGANAFDGCSKLSSVTINAKLDKIPKYCFRNCTGIKSVDLANITAIDDQAFNYCSSLEKIVFKPELKTFGINCFMGCGLFRTFFV